MSKITTQEQARDLFSDIISRVGRRAASESATDFPAADRILSNEDREFFGKINSEDLSSWDTRKMQVYLQDTDAMDVHKKIVDTNPKLTDEQKTISSYYNKVVNTSLIKLQGPESEEDSPETKKNGGAAITKADGIGWKELLGSIFGGDMGEGFGRVGNFFGLFEGPLKVIFDVAKQGFNKLSPTVIAAGGTLAAVAVATAVISQIPVIGKFLGGIMQPLIMIGLGLVAIMAVMNIVGKGPGLNIAENSKSGGERGGERADDYTPAGEVASSRATSDPTLTLG